MVVTSLRAIEHLIETPFGKRLLTPHCETFFSLSLGTMDVEDLLLHLSGFLAYTVVVS